MPEKICFYLVYFGQLNYKKEVVLFNINAREMVNKM